MKLLVVIAVLSAFLAGSGVGASGTEKPRITLASLQKMFHQLRESTNWNIEGLMLWGYYFADEDLGKLHSLADRLGKDGYRVVGIRQAPGRTIHILHIDRVERHTPESLDQRNREFYDLAAKLGIETYEGMDVAPAPK